MTEGLGGGVVLLGESEWEKGGGKKGDQPLGTRATEEKREKEREKQRTREGEREKEGRREGRRDDDFCRLKFQHWFVSNWI